MKWLKFSIDTTTEAIDFISSMLDEIGIEGIEIEDHVPLTEDEKQQMFIDILPEQELDDGSAVIHFYKEPEDCNPEDIMFRVNEGLQELSLFTDIGPGTLHLTQTDDIDWINNWKEFFHPFYATDHICIKPTWRELTKTKDEDIVIEIDPGIAFGTGSHETTKLCIQSLEKYVTNETSLLDVGCGSGILSIAAIKLGAKHAVAIDIDPAATIVTKENAEINGLSENELVILDGNLIDDKDLQQQVGYEGYEVIVANILADIIIPLSEEIGQHLTKDGVFISSGIIYMKKKEVEDALLRNGFDLVETLQMGDWFSFVAKKR